MGEKLANRIFNIWPKHDIDVVIPVPDTARTAAIEVRGKLAGIGDEVDRERLIKFLEKRSAGPTGVKSTGVAAKALETLESHGPRAISAGTECASARSAPQPLKVGHPVRLPRGTALVAKLA